MPIKRVTTREPRALTTEQKVAFGLLLFLGFGGIFLGFKSFGANINRPFDLQIANYLSVEKFTTSSQREAEELEASKNRDTDQDGLTDYDELSIYKTSPYLLDSDSDTFDDKTEIFSNNDPNCPKGSTCDESTGNEAVAEKDPSAGLAGAFGDAASILSSSDVDFKNPEDVKQFFQKATIEEIRAALLKSGVSQDALDKLDDETLMKFFTETLNDASKAGEFDALVEEKAVAE